MPRKKKSLDVATPEPEKNITGDSQKPSDSASEVRIDQEAEHRMQAESPAIAQDAEAELEAQAIDTFEVAFDPEPLGTSVEDLAPAGSAAKKTEKKPKTVRRTRKVKEPAQDESSNEIAAEAEGPTASAVVAVETPAAAATDLAHAEGGDGDNAEFAPEIHPPGRLERLQKILSQAGVASRRHAEELITEGRVQVNGKIVTALGSKADPTRDHIRVDGKLLRGAERLRYFMLNKPRGYVTTVSDPEGRPTVMEFFSKMGERLYPVGRLDYQSEGLLLVTNDGDLANKLTKAASGVEKTYLVKVSGRPTPEELDRLREGVNIDRGKPGEGRVTTAPATVRQVRHGDNPWFEVVLIEGRNRELRKMFEEVGHFVEKIRRVGYGPLVLDQEPGKFRELEPDELAQLRLAAEGKLRKAKTEEQPGRREGARFERKHEEGRRPGRFGAERPGGRKIDWERQKPPSRQARPGKEEFRRPGTRGGGREERFGGQTQAGQGRGGRPQAGPAQRRPEWKPNDRSARPAAPFNAGESSQRRRSYGGQKPPAGFSGRSRPRPEGAGSWRDSSEGRARRTPGRGDRSQGVREPYRGSVPRPPRPEEAGSRRDSSEGRAKRTPGRGDRNQGDRERYRGSAPRPPRQGRFDAAEGRTGTRRFERTDSATRPYRGSQPGSRGTSGSRPAQERGWKPNSGGTKKPGSGGRSRPPSSGGGRGSAGRTGPRRGGKRPGGPGKKRY
jgi:23S rRNA pseudouridine2605 synthase